MQNTKAQPVVFTGPIIVMTIAVACLVLLDGVTKILTTSMPPENIVFARYFVGLILFVPFTVNALKEGCVPRGTKYHFLRGIFGALSSWLFVISVTSLDLSAFVLITQTIPVFSILVGVIFFGEAVYSKRLGLLHLATLGCILLAVGTPAGHSEWTAVICAILGAVIYAISTAFGKKGAQIDGSATATFCTLLFGAIISYPFTVKSAIDVNDPAILSLILALGILTLISRLLSSWALAHGTMASMGALEYTTLFWALCFGFVLFEEVATIDMLVFGTFAAVLGILASRQSAIR